MVKAGTVLGMHASVLGLILTAAAGAQVAENTVLSGRLGLGFPERMPYIKRNVIFKALNDQ